jgi:hypothetical protein
LHGEHGFERWELDAEALAAGTKLSPAELTGAVTEMVDAVFLASDGSGVACAAVVVEMVTSSAF